MVERTNVWAGKYRRNGKEYERTPESAKAMVQVGMIHRILQSPRADYRVAQSTLPLSAETPAKSGIRFRIVSQTNPAVSVSNSVPFAKLSATAPRRESLDRGRQPAGGQSDAAVT